MKKTLYNGSILVFVSKIAKGQTPERASALECFREVMSRIAGSYTLIPWAKESCGIEVALYGLDVQGGFVLYRQIADRVVIDALVSGLDHQCVGEEYSIPFRSASLEDTCRAFEEALSGERVMPEPSI